MSSKCSWVHVVFLQNILSTSPFMFCWNGQLGIRKTYFMYYMYYLSILHFLYFYCILKCSASYLYWSINFAFFIFFLLIIQDSNSSISPQGTIYVPEGPIELFLYLLLYLIWIFFFWNLLLSRWRLKLKSTTFRLLWKKTRNIRQAKQSSMT